MQGKCRDRDAIKTGAQYAHVVTVFMVICSDFRRSLMMEPTAGDVLRTVLKQYYKSRNFLKHSGLIEYIVLNWLTILLSIV